MIQAAHPVIRNCDGCTMCCKVMAVAPLAKPPGVWCVNCRIGEGCAIYEDRPENCRQFICNYLVDSSLGDEWKPSESHIVLTSELDGRRLVANVDSARADSWKRKPYYAALRQWARNAWPQSGQIIVRIGARQIAVLPDRDVDMGLFEAGDQIGWRGLQTQNGVKFEVWRVAAAKV